MSNESHSENTACKSWRYAARMQEKMLVASSLHADPEGSVWVTWTAVAVSQLNQKNDQVYKIIDQVSI